MENDSNQNITTQSTIMVQFGLSDLDHENEPLICADVVSLICADLLTEGCVNQRFLHPLKRELNRYPTDL